MFVRPDLNTTLADLDTVLAERENGAEGVRVAPDQIAFHLDAADPSITLGSVEVPATETALSAFGDLLQFPQSFLKRASGKVQAQHMNAFLNDLTVNTLLKDARATVRQGFLEDIDEWGKQGIAPRQLVQAASHVIDPAAQVARLIDTPAFFGFDVYAPEGFAHGYGGEGVTPYADGNERDDITAGGIRVGLNTKQGLAPTAEEFLFRLACTNGMTMQDVTNKVDARGQSVEEVLAEFEGIAQVAFSRVEESIRHFYDLKSQRVENVERTIGAIARERGLPDRSAMALMRLAASADLPDQPSMFDVVNLVTNFANSPSISRDGGRVLLEAAGGAVIGEHAARCGHCAQIVR